MGVLEQNVQIVQKRRRLVLEFVQQTFLNGTKLFRAHVQRRVDFLAFDAQCEVLVNRTEVIVVRQRIAVFELDRRRRGCQAFDEQLAEQPDTSE